MGSVNVLTSGEGGVLARVYGLLSVTVLVSAFAAVYGMSSPFAYQHPIIVMIGSFAMLFATMFASRASRELGLLCLFGFVALMGYSLGPTISVYLHLPNGAAIVGQALIGTGALFGSLSLYAIVSKRDFSHLGGFLFAGMIALVALGLLNALWFHTTALQLALSVIAVAVFSGLILVDTQRALQDTSDYIMVVLSLYLDLLNLFVALLNIFRNIDG